MLSYKQILSGEYQKTMHAIKNLNLNSTISNSQRISPLKTLTYSWMRYRLLCDDLTDIFVAN